MINAKGRAPEGNPWRCREASATGAGGANLGPLHVVSGNITGLKPSQKHALERVYRRRLRPGGGRVGRAGGVPVRHLARDRAPGRHPGRPARRDRARLRRRRLAHQPARDRPHPRRPRALPRPAPGAHAPAQRAAHPRRPGRPGAAAAGPGGGHRRAARRAARPICTSRTCCRRSRASRPGACCRPSRSTAATLDPRGADRGAGGGVRARRARGRRDRQARPRAAGRRRHPAAAARAGRAAARPTAELGGARRRAPASCAAPPACA